MKRNRILILLICILILLICLFVKNDKRQGYIEYYLEHALFNNNGFRAYYYSNPEWKGEPIYTCIEDNINFKTLSDLSTDKAGETFFSISWYGLLTIPVNGWYKFKVVSDDGMRLFLNEIPLVKNDGVHPTRKVGVRKYLRKGVYPVEVRYFQARGGVFGMLAWRTPDLIENLQGVIPPDVLKPMDSNFNWNLAYRLRWDTRRWDLVFKIVIFLVILCIINLWTGFLERFYYFIARSIRENFTAVLVLILSVIARFLYIGTVPGIFGDEAWNALRAFDFLEGREVNLLRGMTAYTSPFFLFQAPFYILFGFNPVSLRILPVSFNILALLLGYMLIKKIYNKRIAIVSLILLSIWPVNFLYGRISIEIITFNLFFIFLTLYLIHIQRTWHLILAGVVLGAGIYNHLLFICFPISLFLLVFLETRGRIVFYKRFYFVLIPIILILYIKYLDVKIYGPGRTFSPLALKESLYIIRHSISILPEIIDGDILYRLFTGKVLVGIIPINLVVIGICLAILLIKRGLIDRNFIRLVFIIIVTFLIISYRSPAPRLRYFCIPVTLLSLIPSICLGKIIVKENRIMKYLAFSVLSVVIAINIFYITVNYFYSYKKTEGGFFYRHDVKLSYPVFVCSHHYIYTRKLYDYLVANDFSLVASNFYIVHNLLFWDIGNDFIYCDKEQEFQGRSNEALVFYAEPVPGRYSGPERLGFNNLKEITDVENFKIYINEN